MYRYNFSQRCLTPSLTLLAIKPELQSILDEIYDMRAMLCKTKPSTVELVTSKQVHQYHVHGTKLLVTCNKIHHEKIRQWLFCHQQHFTLRDHFATSYL